MACLLQCSWTYCSSISQPTKQHNLQYTWENPVPYQHEATHQTCSRVLRMYSHCWMWQLSVATHRIHVAHSPHIHGGVSVVKTKYRPCPQLSQKWGVASVKSLTWQHLHWTAEVGWGHNRYERQRQSTQSMVTVGLWRWHTGYLGGGGGGGKI